MAKTKKTTTKKKTKKAVKKTPKKKPAKRVKLPRKKKGAQPSSGASGGASFSEPKVIRIILDVAGKFDVDENEKGVPALELGSNLDYTDDLLNALVLELDKYVKSIKAGKSFTDHDLVDCEKVEDVVDKVRAKLI
jgi:hypothetical protein